MPYDLFISYSRRDNERGQVAALAEQIKKSFRAFAGRDLAVFLDVHPEDGIKGMDDWRHKIQRSLRESHLFLAVLSPHYLTSPYCRWEWEDYVRYEAMRQCLGEGVAPVFFLTLPDAASPQTDQAIAGWIQEIYQRQIFDLRPWHDAGELALQQTHVKDTLTQLDAAVRDRLDRAERARRSPNNLIKHNPAFVGRVRELTELRNSLTKNKLGVVGALGQQAPGRATVQGLGGMGKTELALAYAHAFAWDYPGGRWQVPCEHISDLRLALTSKLAGPLGVEFSDDEKKSLEMQFEKVLRELNQRERCLIILDNVNVPEILQPEYLDRLPHDGRIDIIATTRLAPSQIPGSAQNQVFVAVDELPEDDGLSLMRSHQPDGRFSPDEEKEAREIVRLLEGFTLAVETAAIYLGRHPSPNACRAFHERLKADLLHESEQAAGDSTVAVRHRERLLAKTLAFTLETLPLEARYLLDYAALLPADQVAVPWLRSLGAKRFPAFADNNQPMFQQRLELLLGLRLFQAGGVVDSDGRYLIVRVHRMIQQLILHDLKPDARDTQQKAIVQLVRERDAVFEKTINWQDARWELEPFDALALMWDETNHPEAAWLLNQAGDRWHTIAEWSRSEPLKLRALAIYEKSCGPDHSRVAVCLANLAKLFLETNRLAEAEPLMRRALAIDERNDGSDNVKVARRLTGLALLCQNSNRLAEAEPLARRALAIVEKCCGPDHPEVATHLNNLATMLQAMNRLAEAEPLYERALTIDEINYGPDHLEVAIRLNNLATLYLAAKRLAEAEPLMRRALAIDEKNYGPDHPKVATDLNNLAELLRATKRLMEAEPLMRRALAVDEKCYGPDAPSVSRDLNNLATLLQATDRLAEAELLMRRALLVGEKCHGPNHSNVAVRLGNLARLLQATNRLAEAEPLMRRMMEIFVAFSRQTRHPHPHLQVATNIYTNLLSAMGRSREEIMAKLREIGPECLGG